MTNKEKAREIAECNDGHINIISFESAKIMAEWKDQQFKEYLDRKKRSYDFYSDIINEHYSDAIDEIISELFKED